MSSGRRPPSRVCRRVQLPCRRDQDCIAIEGELFAVFYGEVEDMRVRATEFEFAVHAERVVPDHPTAAVKTDFLAEDFQFGGVIVTDGQLKVPVGLEDSMDCRDPLARPVEVCLGILFVPVDIVFVSDVERRIGESQIDAPSYQRASLRCNRAGELY